MKHSTGVAKKYSDTHGEKGSILISMVITCERCGNELTGKAKRWCSKTCSKLGLKSLYRKRKLAEINKYKNDWRRAKNGGNRPIKNAAKYRDTKCLNCSSPNDLQLAHVKPIGKGGTHKHMITLCRKCHYRFDDLLRNFWK